MTLNPIGRIGSLAVAGLLATGLAACGPAKKDGGNAGAVAPAPDRQSCLAGTLMVNTVRIRVADAKTNLDIEHSFALEHLRAALDVAWQTRERVTSPQVKALVQEYYKDLYLLTGDVEGSTDKAKNLADLDASVANLEMTSRRLSETCAGVLKEGDAGTVCDKLDEAISGLYGPYAQFEVAGDDGAKLTAATSGLLAALDELVAELGRLSPEPGDAKLKSAIDALTAGARAMRADLVAAGADPARLQQVLASGHFMEASEKLAQVCHG